MDHLTQANIRNRLLRAFSAQDFALIEPHLMRLPAPAGLVLIAPNVVIDTLYFPDHGFTSVTIEGKGGPIEVGMIGREGLVGASPVLLGVDSVPYQAFIQMSGDNLRIATANFRQTIAQSSTMRALLLRYVHTCNVQIVQTAFANASYGIEIRLARWILMCHDRADGDLINISHDYLSMMLGVRRPGVTVATQVLEGHHLIKATRGQIRVVNREGLKLLAERGYGLAEAEYARLIEGSGRGAQDLSAA